MKDAELSSYREPRASLDAFSPPEIWAIEELSGFEFRGRFWGGFGDPVTDEEVKASAPDPARRRYMPPPTRTLYEAVELVKEHLGVGSSVREAKKIRAWAWTHGYQVAWRGRLPRDLVDAYEAERNRHAVP